MQPPSRRSSFRSTLVRGAATLALCGALAACDRHSATEVPESYGHGSSHEKSYSDHQADSRKNSNSFSDTQGTEAEGEKDGRTEPAVSSPAGEKPKDQFFPGK